MYVKTWEELKLLPNAKQKYRNEPTNTVNKDHVLRILTTRKNFEMTDLEICKFLGMYKFATAKQLITLFGGHVEEDKLVAELDKLVGWHIINKCTFINADAPTTKYPLNESAFEVYSFDIGAKYILENYNDDVNDLSIINWRISDMLGSVPYVVDKLQTVNILIAIKQCNISYQFKPRPLLQARDSIRPTFTLNVKTLSGTSPYIGYAVISSNEMPAKVDSIESYCMILNKLLTELFWKKYFITEKIPTPIFIFSSDKELQGLSRIIAEHFQTLTNNEGIYPIFTSFTRLNKYGLNHDKSLWNWNASRLGLDSIRNSDFEQH